MATTPLADALTADVLAGKTLEQSLTDMPITKWPCGDCAFGRESTNPKFAEHSYVCGWWDDRNRWPLITPAFGGLHNSTEAARCLSRKQAFGPHSDDPPRVCPTFQPKTKEAADGQ